MACLTDDDWATMHAELYKVPIIHKRLGGCPPTLEVPIWVYDNDKNTAYHKEWFFASNGMALDNYSKNSLGYLEDKTNRPMKVNLHEPTLTTEDKQTLYIVVYKLHPRYTSAWGYR